MANYTDIHGILIETVSSDPSDPVNGQVWYNSATQTLKGFKVNSAGSWASGGNLNTGRSLMGSAGIQTAALAVGGDSNSPPPPGRDLAIVESYNGSSWTEVGDLNASRRRISAAGTSTSSIAAGGFEPPSVAKAETWDGSSWTEVGDLNTAKSSTGMAGADSTSALIFSGSNVSNTVELWGGSSWTEVADLNTEGYGGTGAGIATAAICFDRADVEDTAQTVVETWNGSAWTEVANLNTPRYYSGGAGTTTAALCFGGVAPGDVANNEAWNGSAWTEVGDLSANISGNGGEGTQASALSFGGSPGVNTTQEFTYPVETTATFTVS